MTATCDICQVEFDPAEGHTPPACRDVLVKKNAELRREIQEALEWFPLPMEGIVTAEVQALQELRRLKALAILRRAYHGRSAEPALKRGMLRSDAGGRRPAPRKDSRG